MGRKCFGLKETDLCGRATQLGNAVSPGLRFSPGTAERAPGSLGCIKAGIKKQGILGMKTKQGCEGTIWKDKEFRMKSFTQMLKVAK